MSNLRVGVIIGRFQPLLKQQVDKIFVPAINESDLVIVLLGSSNRARTYYDPFDARTREDMIMCALGKAVDRKILSEKRILFEPIRDYMYSDTKWMVQVQSVVGGLLLGKEADITLYGTAGKKYLGDFPHWSVVELNESIIKSAALSESVMRKILFDKAGVEPDMPNLKAEEFIATPGIVSDWLESDEGRRITEEFIYIDEYRKRTQTGKYPTIFHTVDNVVTYKGHILLVKRRSKPGKGLWALPGGFLNADEHLIDGAARELKEETRLNVKREWHIKDRCFDHPKRSLRGRTITHAFLWKIPDWRNVPQIRAGSDASRAKWFPISEVTETMHDQLFEDHLDIIEELTKEL